MGEILVYAERERKRQSETHDKSHIKWQPEAHPRSRSSPPFCFPLLDTDSIVPVIEYWCLAENHERTRSLFPLC